MSPSTSIHTWSIPRTDLKLDYRNHIHPSLAQIIFLPFPLYIQPWFLDLFCALNSNFRNKCSQIPCGVHLLGVTSPFPPLAFHYCFSFSWPTVIFFLQRPGSDIYWCWTHFYLYFQLTLPSLQLMSRHFCSVKNIRVYRRYFPPEPFPPVPLGKLYAAFQPKKPMWCSTMKASTCLHSV